MADTEKGTTDAPIIVRTGDEHAREQLAREMKALAGKPLDRVPAGGYFIGADGEPHDAEGTRIGTDTATAVAAAADPDSEGASESRAPRRSKK